jgi:ribosomal protein S6
MQKEAENTGNLSVFEVGYILLPSLAAEQVLAKTETLKEAIQKAGGNIISLENPTLIDLAYPMTKIIQTTRLKCLTGHFGWIKFEISKEGMVNVKKVLEADNDILRYLLIKTARENTLSSGKMLFRGGDEGKKIEFSNIEPELTAPESTPEEIDKSIDDLVIV